MSRLHRLVLILAVVVPASGCYHYVAVPDAAPVIEEGTLVRVHLNTPRSFDVSGYTAHDVHQVDGALVRMSDAEWILAASAMLAAGGARFDPAAFNLAVPTQAIGSAEMREISWWRSAVSALAVGVGIFLASEALQGTSADGDGGGPDPDRIMIPIP